MMETRAVLAAICGRFELAVAPRMGTAEEVRESEVIRLTLQSSKGIWLRLKLRE